MTYFRLGGATAVALALTACGGGGETRTVTVEATPTEAAQDGTPTPEATATPAGGEIAAAESSLDGGRVRFVVTELRRSGPTVVLNARVEHVGADTEDNRQIGATYSDGESQDLADGATEEPDIFDGVALIDPEGRKKYLVARDETGRCVCTVDLNGTFATAGAPVELQATLSAPPPDVTEVDLFVPQVKSFSGVPIAE